MSDAKLSQMDGQLYLIGEVSFANVVSLRQQGDQMIRQLDAPLVNFAQAQSKDSSACVLILAWMRGAHAQGKTLQLREIPEHLLAVAEVYGIKDVIQSRPNGPHERNKVTV